MTNRIRRDVQRVTAVTKTLGLLRAKLHHNCYPLVANTTKMLICGCGALACRVNFILTNTETPAGGSRQGAGEGHPACPRAARQPVQGFCPDPERGRGQYRGSRPAGMRGLERDHVGRRARDALAWRSSSRAPRSVKPSMAASICWRPSATAPTASPWSRCGALRQPLDRPVWRLEAALNCEPCSEGRHYGRRQRANILQLTYARPIWSLVELPAGSTGECGDDE
jgi:hypothetical protein